MKAGVSGSVGVAVGVGRASGGVSLSKSFGSSLSPEARFGGATSKFSSRSLSIFNKDAISPAPKSILNVNQGREAKSQFATNNSLRSGKSIFDTTRPVLPTTPTFSVPKNEFGVKLNINQAREVKFPTARVKSLEPKKGMFDISRPVAPKEKIVPFTQKAESRKAQPVELKTRPTVQVSPFKDTVILWQNPNLQPQVRPEIKTKERGYTQRTRSFEAHASRKSRPEFKSQTRGEVKHPKHIKKIELKHVIQISPTVLPDKLLAIRRDIKDAKKMAYTVVRARNISYQKAVLEMAQVLARKHEGNVQILPTVQVQEVAETVKSAITKTQTQPKTEQIALVQSQKKSEPVVGVDEKKKKEGFPNDGIPELIFYFKKDFKAKTKRLQDALFATRKLFSYKRDTEVITGADISYEIEKYNVPDQVSEVAKSIRPDGTLTKFVDTLKKTGEVLHIEEAERIIQGASSDDAPVRLSFSPEGEQVGQEGARKVYEGDIDGKRAYFEENSRAFGKFKRDDKNKMWFIPDPKVPVM